MTTLLIPIDVEDEPLAVILSAGVDMPMQFTLTSAQLADAAAHQARLDQALAAEIDRVRQDLQGRATVAAERVLTEAFKVETAKLNDSWAQLYQERARASGEWSKIEQTRAELAKGAEELQQLMAKYRGLSDRYSALVAAQQQGTPKENRALTALAEQMAALVAHMEKMAVQAAAPAPTSVSVIIPDGAVRVEATLPVMRETVEIQRDQNGLMLRGVKTSEPVEAQQ